MRIRRVIPIAVAALFVGCATISPDRSAWVELATPHFDLSSALPPAKSVALAHDLELFRSSVELLAGVPLPSTIRVRVLAFDDRSLSRAFDRRDMPAAAFESGYFLESPAGATIVLRSGGGWQGDATIELRHQYAHYLLRNRGGTHLPSWYDEGMAWLAATIEVVHPHATLGQLPKRPMRILASSNWLPIQQVLDVAPSVEDSANRRNTLRAEAWAFVHDYHFHQIPPSKVGGRLRRILTGGPPEWEAFRRSLDTDLDAREDRLRGYGRRDRWNGIEIGKSTPSVLAEPRAIDRVESMTRLGWLALRLDRLTLAERYFRAALRTRTDHGAAWAGSITVAVRRGRWDEARRHLEEAGMRNDHRLCIAAARLDLEQTRAESLRDGARDTAIVRERLKICAEQGAATSEVQSLIGDSHLVSGDPASARASLERAQNALPSSLHIQLLRARQRGLEGDTGAMRTLAGAVATRTHDDALRRAAYALLEGE